jgi:hypothetical protein
MDKQLHNTSTTNGDSTSNNTTANGTKPLLENMVGAAKSAASTVATGISDLTVSN